VRKELFGFGEQRARSNPVIQQGELIRLFEHGFRI
jgi:hypothetical protein